MANKMYTIGDKEYSKEALIIIGKQHYPKFHYIPRFIGILFMSIGLLMCALLGIVLLILNLAGVFNEPDFPTWVFYIPFGVFGSFFIAGVICFICSFIRKPDQAYIEQGIKYLTRLTANKEHPEQALSRRDQETLARYERLLKGGVITQEEFEKRKNDLLGL